MHIHNSIKFMPTYLQFQMNYTQIYTYVIYIQCVCDMCVRMFYIYMYFLCLSRGPYTSI